MQNPAVLHAHCTASLRCDYSAVYVCSLLSMLCVNRLLCVLCSIVWQGML